MRSRLSASPISDLLTLTENLEIYECENFLLEGAVDRPGLAYWAAHTHHLWFELNGERPYTSGDAFDDVKSLIVNGLEASGFSIQADQLKSISFEDEFDKVVIRQYTEESSLYSEVNNILRRGHRDESVASHPLVPWISHLNAIIRKEEEHISKSFRGVNLSEDVAAEYKVGRQFVWASLTSLSANLDKCLGGNVLFVITPKSPISTYGKRAPRKIAAYSVFPEEEEVLLPLGCAFRVTSNEIDECGKITIELDLYDHW